MPNACDATLEIMGKFIKRILYQLEIHNKANNAKTVCIPYVLYSMCAGKQWKKESKSSHLFENSSDRSGLHLQATCFIM